MYLYETHLHTLPTSKCARASVRENLEFYKSLGYKGVFITNHFIDGNISVDRRLPYEDKINYFFEGCEEGKALAKEIGLDVFEGIESSYQGTDFLVYGLSKEWFLAHPEIESLKKSEELRLFMESGALVIQAHPFRGSDYIDHIQLFPKVIHGVEIYNANRTDFENRQAEIFCENYGLIPFAGSDNHAGASQLHLGGMAFDTPLKDEQDFVARILDSKGEIFKIVRE